MTNIYAHVSLIEVNKLVNRLKYLKEQFTIFHICHYWEKLQWKITIHPIFNESLINCLTAWVRYRASQVLRIGTITVQSFGMRLLTLQSFVLGL